MSDATEKEVVEQTEEPKVPTGEENLEAMAKEESRIAQEGQEQATQQRDDLRGDLESAMEEFLLGKEEEVAPVEEPPAVPVAEPIAEVAEPVATEAVEDPLPEWATALDLTDQNIVDAVNHFNHAGTEEWLRKPTTDMSEDELDRFKTVQQAYMPWLNQQNKEAESHQVKVPDTRIEEAKAKLEAMKQSSPEFYKLLDNYVNDDMPAKQQEVAKPSTPTINNDLMDKFKSAQEEGDVERANIALQELLNDTTEKTKQLVLSDVDKIVAEKLESRFQSVEQEQYAKQIQTQALELADKDPRVWDYLKADSTYDNGVPSCKLGRVMDMGTDPVSGEDLSTPDKAYRWILRNNGGNGNGGRKMVRRPADDAQPPPGAGVGDTPSLTQADMDLPMGDFARKAWQEMFGS